MRRFSTLLLATALSMPAAAQTISVSASPNLDIPDDGYIGVLDGNDGTGEDAGMVCADLDFTGEADGSAASGVLDIGLTHTWPGDLTIKVTSPGGSILPVMARPQGDWAAPVETDDGAGCCGDSSNLAGTLSFADANANDPEALGLGLGDDDLACTGDDCSLFPNPSAAAGGPNYVDAFAGFDGESTAGVWTVCVGDAVAADTGTFDAVTLSFAASVAVEDDPSGEFAFGLVGANPFQASTALGLRVTSTQHVVATLHDLLGRQVAQLHDGAAVAGSELRLTVDGAALPAGTYVVRVTGETFSATQSLTIAR